MTCSIIIPTRNRFDYLSLLLDDLRIQDISNFEVIVVDQSAVKRQLKYCIHIHTETTGPCISRNLGVPKSKGEILLFLDDDARVNSDFVREMTEPIMSGRFDAVAGAICDLEGNYIAQTDHYLTRNNSNFVKVLTSNPNSSKSRITLSFPGCCAAISREAFLEIGGFEESFDPTGAGEDREVAIKLFKKGYATWYNAKAKLLHAMAPIGGSRDVGSRSLMLDVHSYRMCKRHFSKELSDSLKKTILNQYKHNFYNSLLNFDLIRTKFQLYTTLKHLLREN